MTTIDTAHDFRAALAAELVAETANLTNREAWGRMKRIARRRLPDGDADAVVSMAWQARRRAGLCHKGARVRNPDRGDKPRPTRAVTLPRVRWLEGGL
ncbi:hypothetical protein [Alsobacter sp. R-9]